MYELLPNDKVFDDDVMFDNVRLFLKVAIPENSELPTTVSFEVGVTVPIATFAVVLIPKTPLPQ